MIRAKFQVVKRTIRINYPDSFRFKPVYPMALRDSEATRARTEAFSEAFSVENDALWTGFPACEALVGASDGAFEVGEYYFFDMEEAPRGAPNAGWKLHEVTRGQLAAVSVPFEELGGANQKESQNGRLAIRMSLGWDSRREPIKFGAIVAYITNPSAFSAFEGKLRTRWSVSISAAPQGVSP